jgi:hypothetical protein
MQPSKNLSFQSVIARNGDFYQSIEQIFRTQVNVEIEGYSFIELEDLALCQLNFLRVNYYYLLELFPSEG